MKNFNKYQRAEAGLPPDSAFVAEATSAKEAASAEAGQTLFEILLAFGVLMLILSAVILGVTTSLNNTQYTKNQGLANSYAQEGMAVIRKIRDSSWYDFSGLKDFKTKTAYCLGQNSTELVKLTSLTCSAQNPNLIVGEIFSREIKFEHDSSSCAANCPGPACLKGSKAAVKVSWSDNKCPVGTPLCHSVELITCFSNIDQKQTP